MQVLWEAGYHLPPAPIPKKPAESPKKGHCKHCGRKVGRGLHRHEKACGAKR
jgi:hypothetical protein